MKALSFKRHLIALLLVWAAVVFPGCSKQKTADATDISAPATVSAQPDNAAAPPAVAVKPRIPPVVIAPTGPDPSAALAQLTAVLRRFSVERRRVPKSLDELVAAGYLASLPGAPPGKQYAIDPKRLEVVLENR